MLIAGQVPPTSPEAVELTGSADREATADIPTFSSLSPTTDYPFPITVAGCHTSGDTFACCPPLLLSARFPEVAFVSRLLMVPIGCFGLSTVSCSPFFAAGERRWVN